MKIVLSTGATPEATLDKLGSEMRNVDFEVTATRALLVKHRGFFRPSAAQALATSTFVNITYTANFFDPSGIRTSATEFEIPETGEYALSASQCIAGTTTGRRILRVTSRELGILSDLAMASALESTACLSTSVACVPLNKRDIITVSIWQDSGSTINTAVTSSHFSIARL